MTQQKPAKDEITGVNEGHVRAWFKLSGFDPTRLDTGSGKKGKNADWNSPSQISQSFAR